VGGVRETTLLREGRQKTNLKKDEEDRDISIIGIKSYSSIKNFDLKKYNP